MESAGLRERVLDAESALRDAGGHKDELERVKQALRRDSKNLDPTSYIVHSALCTLQPSLKNLNPRC
jgi:hypothetical protein